MSTVRSANTTATSEASGWISSRLKFLDFVELTKPRIAVMVLLTVAFGYTLASHGQWQWQPLMHVLIGVGIAASGASALNQWIERRHDALMPRTASRPLPSGRLSPTEALMFGLSCLVLGSVYLACFTNVTTTVLTALTFGLYALVYTPLKRHTALCTAIGAIPGAMPPILGWTAAGGSLGMPAFTIFAIMFLWQFPHFLAIAWIYREEYQRAGMRMLPGGSQARFVTGLLTVAYALVLLPISLWPSDYELAGRFYFVVAGVLGLAYIGSAAIFLKYESRKTARLLMLTSLIYLPTLLLTMTWDHLQLLR